MGLDWTTLALQLVNFAILVWLLQRFLYRPVLRVIDARRAALVGEQAEAAHEVEAARQAVGRPAEEPDGLRTGEAVSHAIDIGDRVEPGVFAPGRLGQGAGMRHVVLDEGAQHGDHGVGLSPGLGAKVDALMIELTQRGQSVRSPVGESDEAGCAGGVDDVGDPRLQLRRPSRPAALGHVGGQVAGLEHAGVDGVLEVVGAVGDAVGEADHLAFRRGWGRT